MRIRNFATRTLDSLGLASLARRVLVGAGRFALNFHSISSQRYSDIHYNLQPHHSTAEFRQTLDWLSKHFSFLGVEEFLCGAKPGVLLTFDDGYANNYTNVLPILTEYKVQGLFFITTQHVQAPRDWLSFTREEVRRSLGNESLVPDDFARDCYDGLSKIQLAEMGRSPWAVIGAHSVSHPSLPACSREQLHIELTASQHYLQKVSGQEVDCFAYPYGDYNRAVAEAVKLAGYRAAFVVDSLHVGLPAYEIPRVGIYAANADYLSVKLSGLHRLALRGPALT